MKKAEPAAANKGLRKGAPGRPERSDRFERNDRGPRSDRPESPRAPRLGDAAFRAMRQAQDLADQTLRKLAVQAHGEVLTQLMQAWKDRDAQPLPAARELGHQVNAAQRQAWATALTRTPSGTPDEALLRLEIAAEVPTPAAHLDARRALQLTLLTKRHQATPRETWADDVEQVLGSDHDAEAARRLQAVLKVFLR
ncbi:MAG: hypothetical protein RL657_2844, partial [Pseudomonadota bacterium]